MLSVTPGNVLADPYYLMSECISAQCKGQPGCLCAGMQDVDRQTSRALLDFSYHLAIGDMNEAYKVLNPILCYTTLMRSMPT